MPLRAVSEMAGRAHLSGLVRFAGAPTSGRYVYRHAGGWYWQCDLHDSEEPLPEEYASRDFETMEQAFVEALAHANHCTQKGATS